MSATVMALPPRGLAALLGGELRYSRVWEDHALLERGLRITARDEVLCIASAGCNVLNLLRLGPRRIVAIDFNPAQSALVELKLAALRQLDRDAMLELLGMVRGDPLRRYRAVRPALTRTARDWWDANEALLAGGVDGAGRLDRFIERFHADKLSCIHPPALTARLFTLRSRAERRRFVDDVLFTPAFERAFLAYFTREALAGEGRHSAQLRFVREPNIAAVLLRRLHRACTELPVAGNQYLERFLLGNRAPLATLPPWLGARAYARVRALAGRVQVVTADLADYLAGADARTITKAALSDLFEYLSPEESDALFAALGRALRPGGRVAYWNLFVPRRNSPAQGTPLVHLDALSRSLSRQDRAWFYRAFHVEELTS